MRSTSRLASDGRPRDGSDANRWVDMARAVAKIEQARRPNLKQEAAQYVRDMIFSASVRPRERLDQDRIAEDLGISRLPVREALITLEAEGLVESVARRGSFVAALSPQDIMDHYEMYGLLSGMAAARAADSAPSAAVDAIADAAARMRITTEPREHDALNYDFHQAINKAGSSGRLRAVLRTLSRSMPSHFFEHNLEWEWQERALSEHDLIVAALRAGDGKAASEAVAQHFRHTGAQAVRMMEAAGFWSEG